MQYVYSFGNGNADGKAEMKNLLGGKGANLAEMNHLGIPVPPGFTITTDVCTYYYKHDLVFPEHLNNQIEDTLKIVMRSIYLQHASNLPQNITAQVEALNKLVTDYCIPQICGEAEGYIKYKNDVSTLPTPLSHGVSTYSNNILEMKKFF